ncbi:exonuclease mut-7 homolog isoform X2 [Hydra vulgaris]|uniref:exonuclease mut-7 homolog isoform X2 n=1 Tax=Hydra vulgaris TaxID=6087 RepID=UPI000641296E|nr:exonuclease mut-7 homolog isoform X2 [Hydra vulgaris]
MAFKCDVPPPPSKYSYNDLGISLCVDYNSDEEDDNWMVDDYHEESLADHNVDNKNELVSSFSDSDDVACRETNTYSQYNYQELLESIEEKYLSKQDDLVRQELQASFNNVPDPYSFLLHVMYKAFFDLYSKRVPITYFALDEMKTWLDLKKSQGEFVPVPANFQKKSALEFIYRKGYNYLILITNVFQLDNEDNSFLAEVIELENLTCTKFKETVIIVQTLHLQNCFTAEQVMLPLLAFDQLQILESYINEDKDLQGDYVNMLNNLCAMTDEERHEYLCTEKGLVVKDESKLNQKTLSKIASKAVKRYHLNPDEYPEIFRAKNLAGLKYLIYMKWKERNGDQVALQKWDDMIEAAVAGKVWLQQKLVEAYLENNDLQAAVSWVYKVSLPPKYLPPTLLNVMGEYIMSFNLSPVQSSDQEDTFLSTGENWEEEVEVSPTVQFSLSNGFLSAEKAQALENQFYKFKLPLKDVIIVDTIPKLIEAEKILFKPKQVIGFDTEWKPSFTRAGEQDKVSTLQLAVIDKVFIVDMLQLYVADSAENALREFFYKFFTSKDVVKIGYGIVGDLKILIGMFAYMKEFILNASNLVDLNEISEKILKYPVTNAYLYPVQSVQNEKGLSLLIYRLLGQSLDKTFQVSDWDKRPLSTNQIQYAALDAFCLLEVYKVLNKIVFETQIKVNMLENVKLKWLKPTNVPIQRKDKYEKRNELQKKNFQKKPQATIPPPIIKRIPRLVPRPASALKVICDTMLDELGKELRKFGVDTLIATSHDNSKLIQAARKDNRMILTCGDAYLLIKDHVPEGNCLLVEKGSLKEQVKMVFNTFNIVLKSVDIFSRCPMCNSNDLAIVTSNEMNKAFKLKNDILDLKTLKIVEESHLINLTNFTLSNNIEVQMDFLRESCILFMKGRHTYEEFFRSINFFKICRGCGEVYWKNIHDDILKSEYHDIVDKREVDKTYYGRPG